MTQTKIETVTTNTTAQTIRACRKVWLVAGEGPTRSSKSRPANKKGSLFTRSCLFPRPRRVFLGLCSEGDIQALHAIAEGVAADFELFGDLGKIVVMLLEDGNDEFP